MKHGHDHRWTTDELMRLVAHWQSGVSIEEIIEAFNISRSALRMQILRLRQQGVPLDKRRAGNMAGKYAAPWTQSDCEYLMRRRKEGATAEQIATELNRTHSAVQGMVASLRKNGAEIECKGGGRRRLWDVSQLHAMVVMDNVLPMTRERKKAA